MNQQEILACCRPEFAHAWEHGYDALALARYFVHGIAVLQLDASGESARVVLCGKRFEQLFGGGLAREEVQSNFFMLIARLDRPRFVEACQQAVTSGEQVGVDVSWRIDEEDGSRTTHENYLSTTASIEQVGATDEGPLLYLALCNTTKRLHRERELQRAQFVNSLRALFDEAFIVDLDTGVVDPLFNLNAPQDEDGGHRGCSCGHRAKPGFHSYSRRVHSDDKQLFWGNTNTKQILRRLFGPEPDTAILFDLRVRDTDEEGPYHWMSFAITRVASNDEKHAALVCVRNIDQQMDAMRRERELRSRAQHDSLTGIYNRGTTEELITAAIGGFTPGSQCVLAVIDVDHFKQVNDTYGHLMGDRLLVEMAEALKDICGPEDVAGRIGGDEFVVLLRGELGEDYAAVGERLESCRDRMRAFSAESDIEPAVTLSAGVVPVEANDISYRDLFERADRMLYDVKRDGRNGYRLYRP